VLVKDENLGSQGALSAYENVCICSQQLSERACACRQRASGNNGSQGIVFRLGRPAFDAGGRSERALYGLDAELYYSSRGTMRGDVGLGENVGIISVGFEWL